MDQKKNVNILLYKHLNTAITKKSWVVSKFTCPPMNSIEINIVNQNLFRIISIKSFPQSLPQNHVSWLLFLGINI